MVVQHCGEYEQVQGLTRFMPLVSFYTPWKQKTRGIDGIIKGDKKNSGTKKIKIMFQWLHFSTFTLTLYLWSIYLEIQKQPAGSALHETIRKFPNVGFRPSANLKRDSGTGVF